MRRVAPFRRAADPAAFLASRGVGDPVLAPTELGVLEPAALIARGVRALRTRDSEDFQLAAGGMGLNRSHGNGAGWAPVAPHARPRHVVAPMVDQSELCYRAVTRKYKGELNAPLTLD